MTPGINNAKLVGFFSTFFLLLLSYALLFTSTRKLDAQSVVVDHTHKIINNLEYLVSQVKEIEYNYHAYIGTGDETFSGNFTVAVNRTDSLLKLIQTLTTENQEHQERLDTIKSILTKKVSNFNDGMNRVALASPGPLSRDSLYILEYETNNRRILRQHIRKMQSSEEGMLQLRSERLKRFSSTIQVINFVSLFLAFMLAITSFITYRRENRKGKEANAKSEQYKKELESRVNELAEANKEIKEFRNIEKFASTGRIARTIAHEVRNPLTNINLASEQLKDVIPETEENNMLLDMIKRNSTRINQLISNLLNATKFSDLSYKKVSLNDLVDKALEEAADRISLKHITVQKIYDSRACEATVDEDKLKIAFLNIIVNAIEAMKAETGVLRIVTDRLPNKCRITFEDNGQGMNDETISKLFEPFFTNKENGNGLGLTNTQNIILNHKGRINVESAEGIGTKFIIELEII